MGKEKELRLIFTIGNTAIYTQGPIHYRPITLQSGTAGTSTGADSFVATTL